MRRGIALFALAGAFTLLAGAPAGAFVSSDDPSGSDPGPSVVLPTAAIDPALLPPDPLVVTDAELATAGASSGTMQLATGPNLLIVDDDRAQCPNADFATAAGIQAAIEAAPPGGKIKVCPGSYSPIDVHKADLWLQAPRTHAAANHCHDGDPFQNAVIEGTNPAGLVQIRASGVRVEGFTVQGNVSGPGVRTDAAGSGYELGFNEIRLNQYGVDLNTNGAAQTELGHNCIRDNAGLTVGILTSTGFSNVVIEDNFFTGHRCSSIANLDAAGAVVCDILQPFKPVADAHVVHNSFVDDGTVFFGAATDVVIAYNEFLRPFGASVVLERTVGADVSHNHLDGANAASQGIFVGATPTIALDTVIRSNKIERLQGGVSGTFQFFGAGIVVRAPGVEVSQNWVEFNRGSGIFLGPNADGNAVRGNLVVGNGLPGTDGLVGGQPASDGIRVNLGATGNMIENNRLGEPLQGNDPEERANRDHDCHDNNPSGANLWRHNVGNTENQPGLCVKRA
jgi:hypothetical protein